MDPLILSVPEQHDYSDPTVETDPAQLSVWVSDLPLMNIAETVRLLCSALDALNEQKLEMELRFRCLEVYRSVVRGLFDTLDPLNIRQVSMSTQQRRETIAGAAHLFSIIAGGYKLIAIQLQGQGVHGQDAPLYGKAVNRSMEMLGFVLLDCYRYYRAVPPGIISELHQLYRCARHEGLLDVGMKGDKKHDSPETAVLYKYCMLLSLTDPDRLAEGEISLLADVLREHAGKCRVIQGNSWSSSGEGLFLLDLAGETTPRSCVDLKPPVDAGDPFLLDVNEMLNALHRQLAQAPERVRQQSPEAIVLRQMLPGASGENLRREQRHRDGRWINTLLGLEHIHAFQLQLSGKQSPAPATDEFELADCRVLDSSESGMKLFWEKGAAGDARVGDLLGIVEGGSGQHTLLLAIIRSLRVMEEGGMETGVQIIASGLGSVYCSLPDQPGAGAMLALFLSADEDADITATLVASKGLYEEGRTVKIDVGGREIQVRAGRLISDTPVFDRFEFSAE